MTDPIASAAALVVAQKREWLELLTEFEGKNRYAVRDAGGRELLYAAEAGDGLLRFLLRGWLKAARPFTMKVVTPDGGAYLTIRRPWRFYFYRVEVSDGAGAALGAIVRRFALVRRKYRVEDASGQELAQLFGPLLRPWTFFVRIGDREVGAIRKRWSGLLKEAITDADTFGVEFTDPSLSPALRKLLIAATFLVDFVHFEARTSGRD